MAVNNLNGVNKKGLNWT